MYCIQIQGYENVYLSSKSLCNEYVQHLQAYDGVCEDECQIIEIKCEDNLIKKIMKKERGKQNV
jgi:hypothetical protein